MIDLGSQYPAALDVADGDGNPVNAATVTLTITLPDGTTVSPLVANPPVVTGRYRYWYTTAQSGRHVARWVASSPDTAFSDVFEVAEEQTPAILSMADAKLQLGISSEDARRDADLRGWLAAITKSIERYANEVIVARTFTQTEMSYDPRALRLWKVPVLELVSLARWDGTHSWDVTADVFTDLDSGIVELVKGPHFRGRITAVSTAGYTVIPANYLTAASEFLQYVWEGKRGPGTVGAGVIGPDESMDYKMGALMPRKVRDLLGPPRPLIA